MGQVYRAFDRLTRQSVALKRVLVDPLQLQHNSWASDPLLSLAAEFRVLAGLRHPYIVPVLDYGFDANRVPYYTMTLLEGAQSFVEYARNIDEANQTRLIVQLLQALVYLHRRGVIHRDLKPANVLVTATGDVRVMDFGLALDQAEVDEGVEVAGTMAYIAPELWMGEAPSVKSDLYAVGVMLYELFVGVHPFIAPDGTFNVARMLNQAPDLTRLPADWLTVVGRLLDKLPSQRYASAQATIQALQSELSVPVPAESGDLRESFLQAASFVGREHEFAMLQVALTRMLADAESQIWLIGGESGSGKSRFLDELRPHALTAGALVLCGQAVLEGGLFYQLWRDVARSLVLQVPPNDLEASVLKALIPDIATLLEKDVPDAPELLGLAGQERLAFTLIELIKRHHEPLVLLLEDLHWAEDSLFVLQKIAGLLDQMPSVLIVGTYRNDERPSLSDAIPSAQVLRLARLNEAAIQSLAQSMLGEVGKNKAVLELLSRETEGNAFFMVEIVRALAEESGTLSAIGTTSLPASVLSGGIQKLVERRLNRLPSVYRPLLEQVAVAGRSIDEQVLGQLAKTADMASFLQAGADAAVLEVFDGVWRFAHDKLREGVLRALSPQTLMACHRAVAEALEACYLDSESYHEALLEHWRSAANPEKELHYLLSVLKTLVEVRAEYEQAEALIARGLSLLEGKDSDARRASLLNWRSDNQRQQGEYAAARQSAEAALVLAQALALHAEVARSMSLLGRVALEQGEIQTASEHFQHSLLLYRQLNDSLGMAYSLNYLGNLAFFQGDYTTAMDYYQQSGALARQIGNLQRVGMILNNLGNVAISQNNFAEAGEYYQQSLVSSRQIGDLYRMVIILNNLGIAAYFQADYATAMDYYQQSGALARQIGDRLGVARSLNNLAELAVERGTDDLLPTLYEGLSLNLALRAHPNTLQMLLVVARWAANQQSFEDAARLVGLLNKHPATGSDARQALEALQVELAAQVLAEDLLAWMTEGENLDLEVTAQAWLRRIEAQL